MHSVDEIKEAIQKRQLFLCRYKERRYSASFFQTFPAPRYKKLAFCNPLRLHYMLLRTILNHSHPMENKVCLQKVVTGAACSVTETSA